MGDNTNLVDYSYVGNVADAHLLAADCLAGSSSLSNTVAGQVFFITDGKPRPYWDFPRMAFGLLGDDGKGITTLPYFLCVFMAFLSEVAARVFGGPPGFPMFIVKLATLEQYFNIDKVSISCHNIFGNIIEGCNTRHGTCLGTNLVYPLRKVYAGWSKSVSHPRNKLILADSRILVVEETGRTRTHRNA